MIEFRNVSFRYGENGPPVLNGLDLSIREGEYVAIIGANGCGKTTLMKHLNGLLIPQDGSVNVDGLDTGRPADHRQIRTRVGIVFQNPDNQIVAATVEEDVAFGPGNLRMPAADIRERVDRALGELGIAHLRQRLCHTLSGGEKRLVAIAGLLTMEPRYIALDEPAAYLDPAGRKKVLQVISELHRRGISIVHVSHNMDELVYVDRVLALDQGRIILEGPPGKVLGDIEALRAIRLEAPWPAWLMQELRRSGLAARDGMITPEEAISEIAALAGSATPERMKKIG